MNVNRMIKAWRTRLGPALVVGLIVGIGMAGFVSASDMAKPWLIGALAGVGSFGLVMARG